MSDSEEKKTDCSDAEETPSTFVEAKKRKKPHRRTKDENAIVKAAEKMYGNRELNPFVAFPKGHLPVSAEEADAMLSRLIDFISNPREGAVYPNGEERDPLVPTRFEISMKYYLEALKEDPDTQPKYRKCWEDYLAFDLDKDFPKSPYTVSDRLKSLHTEVSSLIKGIPAYFSEEVAGLWPETEEFNKMDLKKMYKTPEKSARIMFDLVESIDPDYSTNVILAGSLEGEDEEEDFLFDEETRERLYSELEALRTKLNRMCGSLSVQEMKVLKKE